MVVTPTNGDDADFLGDGLNEITHDYSSVELMRKKTPAMV
jgi:hypothetical protein